MAKSSKEPAERGTRMTIRVPLLMRQAIRDREKLSKQSAAGVVQGILLTALRVEMELIRRDHLKKPTSDKHHPGADEAGSPLRKVQ